MYYNQDRTHFYKGSWVHGKMHGKGQMVYETGNVYEGEFEKNHRQGSGKMVWHNSLECYEGEGKEGSPSGQGTHTWGDNDVRFGKISSVFKSTWRLK